jgi:hypothetical protein
MEYQLNGSLKLSMSKKVTTEIRGCRDKKAANKESSLR